MISMGLASLTASTGVLSFGGVSFNGYDPDTKGFTLSNNYFNVTLDTFVFDFIPNSSYIPSGSSINPVIDADFNITWPSGDISNMTLANMTTTANIPIILTIPKGLNAIDENFNEVSFNIGDIKISATGTNNSNQSQPTFSTEINLIVIDVQVENNLEFYNNDVEIDVDGNGFVAISEGDTVTAFEGDDVSIIVRYENDFSNDSFEFDNNDIDARLFIAGSQVDSERGEDDVEGGEVGELTLTFDLDNYNDGTHAAYIELEGSEKSGGRHGEVFNFKFSITQNTPVPVGDADNDGVTDDLDLCPNTLILCDVDEAGCELDTDNDGICNGVDTTPEGEEEVEEDLESAEEEEEAEEEVEEEEIEEETEDKEISSWPFIFGLIVGVIGTGLFFILTRL